MLEDDPPITPDNAFLKSVSLNFFKPSSSKSSCTGILAFTYGGVVVGTSVGIAVGKGTEGTAVGAKVAQKFARQFPT
jgi:hypothetical protein